MKHFRTMVLLAAAVLAASSCLKSSSRQNFQLNCSFEDAGLEFKVSDSTFIQPFFAVGNLVGFSAKVSGEEDYNLEGGFALCRGVDPVVDGHASKTQLHCIAHPLPKSDQTFGVFRESPSMPDSHISFNIPNSQSSILPQSVMLNNTHNFVEAVKNGTSLADGPFKKGDWAAVSFKGYFAGKATGTATLRLADYDTFADSVVTSWTPLNLGVLGNVDKIDVSISSSRPDIVKYFCFDHMVFNCTFVF